MKKRRTFLYRLAALMLSLSLCCTMLMGSVYAENESSADTSSAESSDTSEPAAADSADTDLTTGFTVNSTAVYLVNMDTGIVVYQKNADMPLFPASLVKIMTCLLAIENCDDLNTSVTSSYTVFDRLWGLNASNAGLYPGEQLRMIDLLYALMLRSGCDAAGVIAEAIGGSEEAFVEMMNQKAKEIGCTNTHFVNSTGLHDDNQYTTALDMYRITTYAMQYDIFTEIATSYSYTMPATNKNVERVISHTCSIMNPSSGYYNEYVHGIKTGTTDQSGRNLVSYASKDAYNYMLITMGAPIYYENGDTIESNLSFIDALNFYDWAFNDWAVQTIVKTTDVKGQVKVGLCSTKDIVNAVPEKDISRLMLKSIDSSSLQMIPDLVKSIDAPVKKGQVLGTLTVRMADETIATVNLVAAESLEKSAWLSFCRGVVNFFTSPGFWLTVLTLILGFIAWIFIMRQINISRRRKRRAMKGRTGSAPSRSRTASRSNNTVRKAPNYRGPSPASRPAPSGKFGSAARKPGSSRSSGSRTANSSQKRPRR